jgi:CHAD domain-containing protein
MHASFRWQGLSRVPLHRRRADSVSCEFRHDESVRKGVRRVVRKQLKDALVALGNSESDSLDDCVHAVRKNFKRVRAVLRLVRYAIGDSTYQFENEVFRDASRPLSEVRDAKILIETLDKLNEAASDTLKIVPFGEARKKMIAHRREIHQKALGDLDTLAMTTATVKEAIERLDEWTDISNYWVSLGKGLKRVYSRGRKAFDEAKAGRSVESFHEWRKQAKYLRHHMELLAPTWPKVVGELAKQAEDLGDMLGEDHDLAVLRVMLSESNGDGQLAERMEPLATIIDRQRQKLQQAAIPKGELLYRDSPKQFVHRIEAYWKEWVNQSGEQLAVNP